MMPYPNKTSARAREMSAHGAEGTKNKYGCMRTSLFLLTFSFYRLRLATYNWNNSSSDVEVMRFRVPSVVATAICVCMHTNKSVIFYGAEHWSYHPTSGATVLLDSGGELMAMTTG